MKKSRTKLILKTAMIAAAAIALLGIALSVFANVNDGMARKYRSFPNVFGVSYYPVLDSAYGNDYPYGSMLVIEKDTESIAGADAVGITERRTILIRDSVNQNGEELAACDDVGLVKAVIPHLGKLYSQLTDISWIIIAVLIPLEILLRLFMIRLGKAEKNLSGQNAIQFETVDDFETNEPIHKAYDEKKPSEESTVAVEAKTITSPISAAPRLRPSIKPSVTIENEDVILKKETPKPKADVAERFADEQPAAAKPAAGEPAEKVAAEKAEFEFDLPISPQPQPKQAELNEIEFEIELPQRKPVSQFVESPTIEYSLSDLEAELAKQAAQKAAEAAPQPMKSKAAPPADARSESDAIADIGAIEKQVLDELREFDLKSDLIDIPKQSETPFPFFSASAQPKTVDEPAPQAPPFLSAEEILEKYKSENKQIKAAYIKVKEVKSDDGEENDEARRLADVYYKSELSEYD